ncbi:MAG: TIGR01777 family oxidoreductase [Deltaproteobacteria bacterium]|nr:TIGR01777 family oxidoreductase [Deltaproteobacteria bacterium]MBN2846705.1 TIGR01777 family oxidoreductase [Deltaproteobacteria bacterium]
MGIFMTGGTGFVGSMLARDLAERGHEITILTRPGEKKPAGFKEGTVNFLEGDPSGKGSWQVEASHCEVFINLAGASIFSRWNSETKRAIRESRILTTRHLVEAIAMREGKETTLLSTSAVGYYGFHDDEVLNERDTAGSDFLATVAADWEKEALEASKFGARVVICRFGIVLGKGGGAISQMIPLFKYWMGSPLGSGRQWFSWIHERDLWNIYSFLLEHKEISGPVNCSSPNPVRNREMTQALAKALGKPLFLPAVPSFVLRFMLGEFGDILLKGQRVYPGRLMEEGFDFIFSDIGEALKDIVTD